MIRHTYTRPSEVSKKTEVVTHSVLKEEWETREECIKRIVKQFNITAEDLATGKVRIRVINDTPY